MFDSHRIRLALELAALERPTWDARSRALWASGVPLNEGEGSGSGSGEGAGSGGEGEGSGAGEGSGSEGAGGEGEGGSEGDEWTPPTKAEWEKTTAQVKKANEAAEKQRVAAEKAKREKAEKDGDTAAQLQIEREAREKAEKDAADIRAEREMERHTIAAEKIATRLKFRSVADVMERKAVQAVIDDPKAVERELVKIAKASPYLIADGEAAHQRDLGNGDAGPSGGKDTTAVSGTGRLARHYAKSGRNK